MNKEQSHKTTSAATTPRKEMGQKVKTEFDKGYAINSEKPDVIDKNDPHYGWDLGTFVVNGYTRETFSNGVPVFLKNVGDKVTLWFSLTQDINNLNGKSELTISEDTNGYDQFFEIPQTNFKHGTLIIRFTDHEGNAHKPIVYTDFLAANATTGSDTKVQLFEEGDYEVSLDYEIKNNPRQVGPVSIAPTYTNYKIFFEFSIRNGKCKVFPLDAKTNAELRNSKAPNGFKLDMAKSRYLTIDVTRTVLNIGSDGLIAKDERFNRPAKDNDTYTDEGIYTFKVKNLYTEETSTNTIFVGTGKYILALAKSTVSSQSLDESIKALNEQLALGASIEDDGTIVPPPEPEPEPEPSPSEEPEPEPSPSISESPKQEEPAPKESESQPVITPTPPSHDITSENPESESPDPEKDDMPQSRSIIAPIVAISVIAAGGIIFMIQARKKKNGES